MRCEIPLALRESRRFSACIVRFAMTQVLVISLYGFANRYREGKRPNDLLLASVIPVITEVGLPFFICGDFNEPVQKLGSFKFSEILVLLRLSNGINQSLGSRSLLPAGAPPVMIRPFFILRLLNGLLTCMFLPSIRSICILRCSFSSVWNR